MSTGIPLLIETAALPYILAWPYIVLSFYKCIFSFDCEFTTGSSFSIVLIATATDSCTMLFGQDIFNPLLHNV